jgi:hypothetical protein
MSHSGSSNNDRWMQMRVHPDRIVLNLSRSFRGPKEKGGGIPRGRKEKQPAMKRHGTKGYGQICHNIVHCLAHKPVGLTAPTPGIARWEQATRLRPVRAKAHGATSKKGIPNPSQCFGIGRTEQGEGEKRIPNPEPSLGSLKSSISYPMSLKGTGKKGEGRKETDRNK